MARVQPPSNILHTRESWYVTGSVASGHQTDDLSGPFPREVCQAVPDYCSGTLAERASNGIRDTFQVVARSITIRVAERLARYICSLMRTAATLATPETECLLYESIGSASWSELIGAATETATINRNRAPSGPVKVSVPTQPQERPQGGIRLQFFSAANMYFFCLTAFSASNTCFFASCIFSASWLVLFTSSFSYFPEKCDRLSKSDR